MEEASLFEFPLIEITHTWINTRLGDKSISKILHHFLLDECMIQFSSCIKQWISSGGDSNNHLVFLKVKGDFCKPLSPFKFNALWIQNEYLCHIMDSSWVHYHIDHHQSVEFQFLNNLKILKSLTIPLIEMTKDKNEKEPAKIEVLLDSY